MTAPHDLLADELERWVKDRAITAVRKGIRDGNSCADVSTSECVTFQVESALRDAMVKILDEAKRIVSRDYGHLVTQTFLTRKINDLQSKLLRSGLKGGE